MTNNKKDIVIIGGGASGLMCALTCILKGKKVCILEKGFKVGKKILVSGNGRCNLTNKNVDSKCYNNFPKQLNLFNNVQTLELFNKLGLKTYFDDEGRCYPISNHSSSVLEVILNKLDSNLCEIITNCDVFNLSKTNAGFLIKSSCGDFSCNKVVVCCGGNSFAPVFDGLNISYESFKPSLCGLKVKENNLNINGIRIKANVKVEDDNGFCEIENGEVIFKDGAVSGICIFNLSAKMNWKKVSRAKLSLNLMPDCDKTTLYYMLNERKTYLSELTTQHFFDGLFQQKLGLEILSRCKINFKNLVSELNNENLEAMCDCISNFTFNVVGFDNNFQVHSGGVYLNELTDNLEVKKIQNLFMCGEAVNVDGICGGYNLQWAWTSGHIVGENL